MFPEQKFISLLKCLSTDFVWVHIPDPSCLLILSGFRELNFKMGITPPPVPHRCSHGQEQRHAITLQRRMVLNYFHHHVLNEAEESQSFGEKREKKDQTLEVKEKTASEGEASLLSREKQIQDIFSEVPDSGTFERNYRRA